MSPTVAPVHAACRARRRAHTVLFAGAASPAEAYAASTVAEAAWWLACDDRSGRSTGPARRQLTAAEHRLEHALIGGAW